WTDVVTHLASLNLGASSASPSDGRGRGHRLCLFLPTEAPPRASASGTRNSRGWRGGAYYAGALCDCRDPAATLPRGSMLANQRGEGRGFPAARREAVAHFRQ
ncbi:hypothetical protein P7K49_027825, partial [Saguinus oedipus]